VVVTGVSPARTEVRLPVTSRQGDILLGAVARVIGHDMFTPSRSTALDDAAVIGSVPSSWDMAAPWTQLSRSVTSLTAHVLSCLPNRAARLPGR